jgi:hypothetical protein
VPDAALLGRLDLPHGIERVLELDDDADSGGTDALLNAITGVPQGIASINTNPNGSGQAIGASSAIAPLRKLDAGHHPAVASRRVQDLLALEIPRSAREAENRARAARSHPTNEQGEPIVGRSTNPTASC